MAQQHNSARFGQGAIYTLAQKGTTDKEKPPVILIGKGSDMSAKDYGKRKCKKKTITGALVLRMIDIAKQEGREDIVKSLWNTWHCQNKVYTYEGRMYSGKYCKNRHCTICLGIRKADMINKYYPVLKEWNEPYFVTLTVRSVPKKRLNEVMKACLRGLNRIIDKYEKRAIRGNGKRLVGIRTLESNFNPYKRTYNPHLHLIVPDQETSEILKAEWLLLWKYESSVQKNWVVPKAQKIDKVWNLDSALIEVIKYGTKVFTDPEGKKKPKGVVKMYARAFYNIIKAMRGVRLFGSFGFTLPKIEKEDIQPARVVIDHEEWTFAPELQNWINTNEWETLFDKLPDPKVEELLEWCIDRELE